MEVSPSGEWLAFLENYHVYVVPMPPGGKIDLSLQTKAVPQRRATDIGGTTSTGSTATRCRGHSARRCIARRWRSCSRAARTRRTQTHGKVVANLSMTRAADKPHGVVALTGARIVTMNERSR